MTHKGIKAMRARRKNRQANRLHQRPFSGLAFDRSAFFYPLSCFNPHFLIDSGQADATKEDMPTRPKNNLLDK
jgi:hypothetical protein